MSTEEPGHPTRRHDQGIDILDIFFAYISKHIYDLIKEL